MSDNDPVRVATDAPAADEPTLPPSPESAAPTNAANATEASGATANVLPSPPPPPLIRRHLTLSESGSPIFAPPTDALPTESDPPDASLLPSSSLYESDSLPPPVVSTPPPAQPTVSPAPSASTGNAPAAGPAMPPQAFPPPVARVAGVGPDPGRAPAAPPPGAIPPTGTTPSTGSNAPATTPPVPQARTSGSGAQPGVAPPPPAAPVIRRPPTPQARTSGPGPQPGFALPPAAPVLHVPTPQARTSGQGPSPGFAPPAAYIPPAATPQQGGYGVPQAHPPRGYTPPARPSIGVRNLQHVFPGSGFQLWVPQLDLMPGELTYIGGASGSGKSTLIKFLAMESKLEHGNIWIMDRPLRGLVPNDLADLKGAAMTYIPQGHLGLVDLSAIENIARVLKDYDGLSRQQSLQQAALALRMAGLDDQHHNKRVKLLSGGQQARVAIAKVFARGRPICLSDEILPALDDKSRLAVLHLFQQLIDSGGFTVVMIAHQPELKKHFRRVIEMRDGQIINDTRQQPVPVPQIP